jgi:hypothetical protein
MSKQEAFKQQLEAVLRETGGQLKRSTAEVAAYAAERAAHLARIVGQPGFEEAVKAERDSVALYSGVNVTNNADAADNRIIGLIQGSIALLSLG